MATRPPHYNSDGIRLTNCCQAFSTYDSDSEMLLCNTCRHAVVGGQGDGTEHRVRRIAFVPTDHPESRNLTKDARPKFITFTAVRRYLNEPDRCPFCKGEEFLTGQMLQNEIGEVYQWIGCNTCESEWRDVYRLAHVDGFEQGDYAKLHGFNL